MASLDVFNSDAFSAISLTQAVEKVPYLPTMLGDMGIFESIPVRTTTVFVEERAGTISLIQTDVRGAPPKQRTTEQRSARSFNTVRIAQSDTLQAHELQNIRAFGSETEFMAVQAEFMRRMVGPAGVLRNIELTWENMRLGAIQGVVTDADSSTIEPYDGAPSLTVACTTLDTFAQGHGIDTVHLLKCDAEGAEPEVLAGATELLARTTWVAIDCGAERHGATTVDPVRSTLEAHGFDVTVHPVTDVRVILLGHRRGA